MHDNVDFWKCLVCFSQKSVDEIVWYFVGFNEWKRIIDHIFDEWQFVRKSINLSIY